jgi:hypothetical protein
MAQMRSAISLLIGVSLALSAAYASAKFGNSTQADKSDQPASQQSTDPQKKPKFRITLMSDGFMKSGAHFGGTIFVEEKSGMTVWRYNVYLRSADAAKKEFDDEVADDIKSGGQLKPDKRDHAASEKRGVVAFPPKDGCAELTTIRFTDDAILRVVISCSSEIAHEFEESMRASTASAAKVQDAR